MYVESGGGGDLQVPQTGKNPQSWVSDRWWYLSACVYEVNMHNVVMFFLLLQPNNCGNV